MNNKVVFIIFNNQVIFQTNQNQDIKEWYISLGGDINNFDNLIRGFVMNNKMVFFKTDFKYDQEVIDAALTFSQYIKTVLKNDNLKVCCGILTNGMYDSWEPILVLGEKDFANREKVEIEDGTTKLVERLGTDSIAEPMIEFKNDFADPEFQKLAVRYTKTVLFLCIVIKVILIVLGKAHSSGFDLLLILAQIGLLGFCIHGFQVNHPKIKLVSVLAAASLFLMFDIGDILLGAFYLLFVIDAEIIKNGINLIKKIKETIKGKLKKNK